MNSMVRWMCCVLMVLGAVCSVSCRAIRDLRILTSPQRGDMDERNFTVVNNTDRAFDFIFVPPAWGPDVLYVLRLNSNEVFSVQRATSKQMKERRETSTASCIYLRDPRTGEIHVASFDWWDREQLNAPHVYIEKSESGAEGGGVVFEGDFRAVRAEDYKTGEHLELLRRFWDVEGGG